MQHTQAIPPYFAVDMGTTTFHPNGKVVVKINVLTTDGGQSLPIEEDISLGNGVVKKVEIASDRSKEGWFRKLGYLVSRYNANSIGWNFDGKPEDCVLKGFPSGYELFVEISPGRRDLYLYGSKNVLKFRSAQEFHPHLVWLMKGKPRKPNSKKPDCECHYCSKTSRKDLNTKYPLPVDNDTPAKGPLRGSGSHTSRLPKKGPYIYHAPAGAFQVTGYN